MPNPHIVFDESGNTGQDLGNPNQPVFVLSSVHLDDDKTNALLRIFSSRGQEVKFKKLRRTKNGQRKVIEFLNSGLITKSRVKLALANKRYMIVTKMVDILLETMAHYDGLDLYKNGMNLALSNLYYYCMPAFCGERKFNSLLSKFVDMVRMQSCASVNCFYEHLLAMIKVCTVNDFKMQIELLFFTKRVLDQIFPITGKVSLDPAIPLFVSLCDEWGNELNSLFDIFHDESKPIKESGNMLSELMDQTKPENISGFDRRKMTLPLKATGITYADSEVVKQIQVADILAGSCAYWANSMTGEVTGDQFAEDIGNSSLPNLLVNSLWPSTNVTPKELGTDKDEGTNPIDGYMDFINS